MKAYNLIYIALAATFAACSDELAEPTGTTSPAITAQDNVAEPGQALVKTRAGVRINGTETSDASLNATLKAIGTTGIEPLFISDSRRKAQEAESGLDRWYIVHFDKDYPVAQATVALSEVECLEAVQANRRMQVDISRRRHIAASAAVTRAATAGLDFFNDPGMPYQWNYINTGNYTFESEGLQALPGCDVNCAEAWPLCTGDPSIIVAVMDEGVMYTHPDLAANIWVNEAETLGSGIDADGNGYKGDRHGWNCVRDNEFLTWFKVGDTGHGTHVAGTIAAVNNNGIGVSGIAGGSGHGDGVKIMPLQVFDDGYTCLLTNECRGMKYAADNGAVILQCSWGYNSYLSNPLLGYTPGPKDTEEWTALYPLEKEALDYFINYAGSPNGVIEGGLAFFASGNEYAGKSSFPACYEKCISVAAVSADFTPSSYTDYGSEVDLCAPGGDLEQYCKPGTDTEEFLVGADAKLPFNETQQAAILSTCVVEGQAGYSWYEGTSMACPNAAGVAALGLSYAKKLGRHFRANEFRDLIISSARDINSHLTGEKIYYYNHTSHGATTTTMNLADYRGKMGRMVDAGALLRAVENGGYDMVMPNVKLAPGTETTFELTEYFRGESSFSCSGTSNGAVATVSVSGTKLTVKAVSEGFATATIKAGSKTQTIVITVKRSNPHGGWLVRGKQG